MAKITTGSKTVAAAGTRERLVTVANNVAAKALTIVARKGNGGRVYVGDSGVTSANSPELNPGDTLEFTGEHPFNLSDVYLDVESNGEGVDYWAME